MSGRPGRARATLRLGGLEIAWGSRTYLLAIVNATPDSFSGDGLSARGDGAYARAAGQAVDDGADLVDVGGVPLYAGAGPVSRDDELARVVPAVREIVAALPGVPVSVDTSDAEVARRTLDEGAVLINSAWGLHTRDGRWNRELAGAVAERGAAIVLTHNACAERVVQETYGPRWEVRYDDVMREVVADLRRQIEVAAECGVAADRMIVDCGPGLGKGPEDSLLAVRELRALAPLGAPVLLAHSRKSFLGRLVGGRPDERDAATVAATTWGIAQGADMIRVHDVRANKQAALVADALVRG